MTLYYYKILWTQLLVSLLFYSLPKLSILLLLFTTEVENILPLWQNEMRLTPHRETLLRQFPHHYYGFPPCFSLDRESSEYIFISSFLIFWIKSIWGNWGEAANIFAIPLLMHQFQWLVHHTELKNSSFYICWEISLCLCTTLLWYGKQKENDAAIWTFYTFPATSATVPLTFE